MARAGDAAVIGALHVRSWRYGYRGLVPDSALAGLDLAERTERWREKLESPGPRRVFLALRVGFFGPELGAFCAVGPAREPERDGRPGVPTGELYALYADPDAFGRGAAHAAHAAGMDHLAATGHRHAVLWVLAENPRAHAFYRGRGWRADGLVEEQEYVGVEMSVARFSRELADGVTAAESPPAAPAGEPTA
ncbi:GNAT family N-acetyltransferase [Pseudonocardia acaciae]|uniref:GNAT family N-acetyltransferase n=1 Tax=Pseudonocardia acaciae TaxID=551276 RepID=UPI00068504E1|nr:GNAT family N-acetyltransferase [Pseudonocardia acaciae]